MDWEALPSRIVFDAPDRLTDVTSWHTHVPFAFWCVEVLRPRLFVELGTHKGDSYSAFCQAVKRLALPTACYAVDTWKGDHEAGFYSDEVLEELRAYHDPRYAAFSRLVRATFDEALAHFADGSIDLLHIDGLHTYEAVSHDFETWLLKLSRRAVVLFHDVNVREPDFGTWRFWEEVRVQYPHFTFLHGHGLGVLLVGREVPEPLRRLAACPPESVAGPRTFFAGLGHQVELTARVQQVTARLEAADQDRARQGLEEKRLVGEVARLEEALAELREATARQLEVQRAKLARQAGEQLAEVGRAAAEAAAQAAREAERASVARLNEAIRGHRDAAAQRLAGLRAEFERATSVAAQEAGQRLEALRAERDLEVAELRKELLATRGALAGYQASWPSRLGERAASVGRLPARIAHAMAVVAETLGWAARFRLREGLRLRKHARMIRRAWLLDPEYYLAQCGDDSAARRDPIRHYLQHGAAQGLDPNPFFDTSYYVHQNRAVADYGKNPLIHFIRYGARGWLNPSPAFNTGYYLDHGPHARDSGLNPLSHYLVYGRQAGSACAPQGRPSHAVSAAASIDLLGSPGLLVPPRNRVLVVDHRMLTPDQDSGSVRMFAIVKLLAELGHEVTFASDSEERMPRYEEEVRRHASPVLFGMAQVVGHLRQEGGAYRHVLLSRPEQAHRYLAAVRAFAPNAAAVYDTIDLHWVRMMRAANLTGDTATREDAERFRNMERTSAIASDLVLAITEQERSVLSDEAPTARVAIVPNIHSLRGSVPGPEARRDLFFIGGFEHRPNVDAVQWFVREVLPRIRQAVPDVVFNVVGSKPPDEVLALASRHVKVAGYVPDPDPFFDGSRVFVSPLRYGAGMKGKIGQAMSYGLPVVTTSIGAEGMRLVDGENAMIADEPDAFAKAVIRVYRDPSLWGRLSENSRRHVEANFSESAVRPLLAELFPFALPRIRPVTLGTGREGKA